MLKLMFCLFCAFVIGIITLQLRQQELELRHQSADLQHKIQAKQAKLWSQQVEIAIYTAPNAVAKSIGEHQLDLVPEGKLPAAGGDWTVAKRDEKKP
jgi:hypothetical protein